MRSMKKKKTIIIILSAALVFTTLLSACTWIPGSTPSDSTEAPSTSAPDGDTDAQIRALEAQIRALLQDHQLSDAQSKKEIAELRAEIEKLKSEKQSDDETEVGVKDEENIFRYTVIDGMACITQIESDEKNIVIPYLIDGYKVYSIGSDALSSASVESIVISSGIEKIDWFAFKGCPSLVSVSIPDTISSIGYGAFDGASSSFVIRCSRDSFAQRYAKSYGITYDIS